MCGPPLTQVRGRRGGSADVEGKRGERELESGWVLVGSGWAPKIMGARTPSSFGRFGDLLLFFIAAKS